MNTTITETIHGKYVHNRRTEVLARWMARMAPPHATILDVGCGDGLIASRILSARTDVTIQGIDVLARQGTHIPVAAFDGTTIPYDSDTFDCVMFVDVLHHTDDATVLLREARRVTRGAILIKDHLLDGMFAESTLRFMDRVGNARHGVRLPYNYWPRKRWQESFQTLEMRIVEWHTKLGVYPFPASLVFGRGLHFVASLKAKESQKAKEPK